MISVASVRVRRAMEWRRRGSGESATNQRTQRRLIRCTVSLPYTVVCTSIHGHTWEAMYHVQRHTVDTRAQLGSDVPCTKTNTWACTLLHDPCHHYRALLLLVVSSSSPTHLNLRPCVETRGSWASEVSWGISQSKSSAQYTAVQDRKSVV